MSMTPGIHQWKVGGKREKKGSLKKILIKKMSVRSPTEGAMQAALMRPHPRVWSNVTITLMPIYPYAARPQGSLDRQRQKKTIHASYHCIQTFVFWVLGWRWNVVFISFTGGEESIEIAVSEKNEKKTNLMDICQELSPSPRFSQKTRPWPDT